MTPDLIARLTDSVPVLVCAWCTPRVELDALARQYPGRISHGLCPKCALRFEHEGSA